MTVLDVDAVLETHLPARFGVGPADDQPLETDRGDDGPGLELRVHPRVGPLDEGVVRNALLDAIGAGSGAERVMATYWRAAGLPRVERKPPACRRRASSCMCGHPGHRQRT